MSDDALTGLPLLDEVTQSFLRAVSSALGTEKAKEVTGALTEILGSEWRNRVIYNKMASTYQGTTISLIVDDMDLYKRGGSPGNSYGYKISAIKELRAITGMGLTESKAAIERAEGEVQKVTLDERTRERDPRTWETRIMNSVKLFRGWGFKVVYA